MEGFSDLIIGDSEPCLTINIEQDDNETRQPMEELLSSSVKVEDNLITETVSFSIIIYYKHCNS